MTLLLQVPMPSRHPWQVFLGLFEHSGTPKSVILGRYGDFLTWWYPKKLSILHAFSVHLPWHRWMNNGWFELDCSSIPCPISIFIMKWTIQPLEQPHDRHDRPRMNSSGSRDRRRDWGNGPGGLDIQGKLWVDGLVAGFCHVVLYCNTVFAIVY